MSSNPQVEEFRAAHKSVGSVTTAGGTTLEVFASENGMMKFLFLGPAIDCWFELSICDAHELYQLIAEAI